MSQGRPAHGVSSFVSTFAAPVSSLVSPSSTAAQGLVSPNSGTVNANPSAAASLPIVHQPFVVGPGYSPILAKLVSQIVAGKFVDLLSDNH